MANASPVRVEGLLATNRRLKAVGREASGELRHAEVDAASIVAAEASVRAPRGTRPLPKNRRLRLHEAVRPLVRGTKTYVGATARQAPHGNVNHWGGTIRPRGVPIYFSPRRFIIEAYIATRPEFIARLAERLDAVFRRNGF